MKTSLTILGTAILMAVSALAQQPARTQHPGVRLYEQAKFNEATTAFESAVKTSEFKSDPEIWNYLGLSYMANDRLKNARKAFEKSVALQPGSSVFRSNLAFTYFMSHQLKKAEEAANAAIKLDAKNPGPYQVRASVNLWNNKLAAAESDVDRFIQLDPTNPRAYVLKSDILLAELSTKFMSGRTVKDEIEFLKRAADTLALGKTKCKGTTVQCSELAHEYESVNAFYNHFSRDRSPLPPMPGQTAPDEPGVTPAKILRQPPASYTDRARTENVQGAVRVAILLGASGQIENIMFLSKIGFGLDQEVLKAVRAIRFEPKMVDGKPVSSVIIREYTFAIY